MADNTAFTEGKGRPLYVHSVLMDIYSGVQNRLWVWSFQINPFCLREMRQVCIIASFQTTSHQEESRQGDQ